MQKKTKIVKLIYEKFLANIKQGNIYTYNLIILNLQALIAKSLKCTQHIIYHT